MHENILPLVENIEQPSYAPYGYSNLGEHRGRTSSSIQTNSSRAHTNSSEQGNEHATPISVSPILPGTRNITHNVTRMLEDSLQTQKSQLPNTSPPAAHFSPYSTAHFMSFRHNILHKHSLTYDTDIIQEEQTSDISNSDMSISTDGSASPKSSASVTPPPPSASVTPPPPSASVTPPLPSEESSAIGNSPSSVHFSPLDETKSSADSSPSGVSTSSRAASSRSSRATNTDRVCSVEDNDEQPKKKARTNYTKEQVQALLKIFHEAPYPDSEMMEDIGKDLGINEKQVKIWFQNKRARWRRRVSDIKNNNQQYLLPMTHMLSPVASYGFMPTGHMMTSSPIQNFPGQFNYPWTQGSQSPNYQHLPRQIMTNQNTPNYQATNPSAALQDQSSFAISAAPSIQTMSSAQYGRTLPQQDMSNQSRHLFQHPGFM